MGVLEKSLLALIILLTLAFTLFTGYLLMQPTCKELGGREIPTGHTTIMVGKTPVLVPTSRCDLTDR